MVQVKYLIKATGKENVSDQGHTACTTNRVNKGNESFAEQGFHIPVQCTDDLEGIECTDDMAVLDQDRSLHAQKHSFLKSVKEIKAGVHSDCCKLYILKDFESTKDVLKKKIRKNLDEHLEPLDLSKYLKNPFKQGIYYQDLQVCMMQQATSLNEKISWPEKFQYELHRLSTYINFPSTYTGFLSKFSRDGFIYHPETSSIICFICDLRIHISELNGVNISIEHKKKSPSCPMVTGVLCHNKPVPAPPWSHHSNMGCTDASLVSEQHGLDTGSVTPTVMAQGTARFITQPENLMKTYASSTNDAQSGGVSTVSEKTSAAGESTEKTDPSKKKPLTYADLGIFAEKPKRPDMAVLWKRVASFKDKWDKNYTQTPKMLAEAGMYYAGYADCARCFFCGGGLKNWEPQDYPWIEHARWFPKCGYVRLVRGPDFVEIVQDKNKNRQELKLEDVEEEQKKRAPYWEPPLKEGVSGVDINPHAIGESMPLDSDTDIEKLESENEELKSQIQCKICMDAESSVVFLPCGHLVSCTQCAHAMKQCPLCRTDIKGSVRAHLG